MRCPTESVECAGRAADSVKKSLQGFLDSALVVGSFHMMDRLGEEGPERVVRPQGSVLSVRFFCLLLFTPVSCQIVKLLTKRDRQGEYSCPTLVAEEAMTGGKKAHEQARMPCGIGLAQWGTLLQPVSIPHISCMQRAVLVGMQRACWQHAVLSMLAADFGRWCGHRCVRAAAVLVAARLLKFMDVSLYVKVVRRAQVRILYGEGDRFGCWLDVAAEAIEWRELGEPDAGAVSPPAAPPAAVDANARTGAAAFAAATAAAAGGGRSAQVNESDAAARLADQWLEPKAGSRPATLDPGLGLRLGASSVAAAGQAPPTRGTRGAVLREQDSLPGALSRGAMSLHRRAREVMQRSSRSRRSGPARQRHA